MTDAAKIEMAREICALISEAILAERERCIEAAKAAGNFGDYQRDELTADYGQSRFDMMNSIISAILNPHSLPSSLPVASTPVATLLPATGDQSQSGAA